MLSKETLLYPAYIEMATLMIHRQRGIVDDIHIDQFSEMLASMPEYCDIMEPWTVSIEGDGEKDNVLSAMVDGDFRKFIDRYGQIRHSSKLFSRFN